MIRLMRVGTTSVQDILPHLTHARTQGGFGGFGRTPPATGNGPLLHSLVVYHSRTLHGIHA